MNKRVCPNCGKKMPWSAASCSCGFQWSEGVDVPAPEIVRAAVHQAAAVDRIRDDGKDPDAASPHQEKNWQTGEVASAGPATPAGQTAETRIFDGAEEDELIALPMPWESGGTAPVSASSQAKSASSGEREKPMLVSDTMEKPATTAKPATATGEAPTPQPNLAMLMPCPSCSSRISKRAELCPKCKEAPYNNCQVCSTKVLVNCGSCPECGDPDPFNA